MQLLKKAISLLLVVAMLSSFALVASAEDTAEGSTASENLVLKAYRDNGTEIGAGDAVTAGETIKVRVITTEDVLCSSFVVLVDYDSTALQANKTASKKGQISSEFDNTAITVFTTDWRDEEHVPVGTPAIQLTYGAGEHNVTAPAGTVWAEFNFTTLKETAGTTLTAHLTDGLFLKEVDHGEDGILLDPFALQGIVPGNVTVAINAAPVAVESVAVTPNSVTLNPGKTQQLTATITPDGAEATVTWKSNNEEVATVSDTGLVTAVAVGDATITATADGKEGTCAVKVEAADPITKFENFEEQVSVTVGQGKTLTVNLATSDGSVPEVKWTVTGDDSLTISDEKVLSTKTTCKVTGTKVGIAYVTATSGTHSVTFTVETITAYANNVSIDSSVLDKNLSYPIGRTIQLRATITPEAAWNIRWQTSDPAVAQIDGDVLTIVGAGTATISALAGGKTANVTITAIDNSQSAQSDYTVGMSGDATQRVANGNQVAVPITIAANNSEAFNDVDLTVTFDPTKLEAVNLVEGLNDCSVEISNGKIHVTRYGDAQTPPTVLKVYFNVKMTEGTTDVVLTNAYVDLSANALGNNAPPAAISRATTTLEIASVHKVTLPETMESSQGSNVADGEDYTFSVKNKDAYHDYDVKATMNGADAAVIENTDGTYTIKNVTGDVTIQMTATAKKYNVAFFGPDATGESSATYGQDYTFTVTEQEGYTHEVSVTIGGKDYTVVGVNGTYRISGADIKGDIQVNITKKDASGTVIYTVKVAGTGASDVTADATAKANTAFAFTLKPADHYYYTVEVTVGGMTRTATETQNADGTKTYTISAANVTGNIWINVTKDDGFTVTFDYPTEVFDSDGLSVKAPTSAKNLLAIEPTYKELIVKKGDTYTFTVSTFIAYDLRCVVTEGGTSKAVQDTLGRVQGTRVTHTFTIEDVQGDLNIQLSRTANTKYVEVQVKPFVELDGKTVFLVATLIKADAPAALLGLDVYDGHPMYRTKVYKTAFENKTSNKDVFLWLTIVAEGEKFGVDEALEHLYYANAQTNRPGASASAGVRDNADVNLSGMVDINDAQLIFDIYNGSYQSFYRTNATEDATIPGFKVGASMDKFLEADVNRDMKIDLADAAAVVAKIK